MHELVGADLAQTLEAGDLHARLEGGDGLLLLLGGVAVAVLLLVAHAEERRLQDVHVSAADQVGVVLHEEGQHQHADVHAVVIGIGGDDDVVVAEVLEVVLDAEGGDKQVQLFVLRKLLAALLVAVERLAAQREDGLVVGVARLGDRSACGVALRDEDGGVLDVLLGLLRDLVVEVEAAVAELGVIDVGALVALAGLLLDAADLLALLLGGLDLVLDHGDDLLVHAEIVVQVLGHEVVDVGADGGADVGLERAGFVVELLLPHVVGPELGLGLAFEVRLLDLDADGAHDALAAVLGLVVLLEELLERLGDGLAVGGEVRAAVAGVLAVDEGGDVLAVGVAVAQHDLDVLALEVDGRVEGLVAEVLVDEVQQAVLGLVGGAVEVEGQPLLEVGVVLDHRLHEVHVVGVLAEHHGVRGEGDEGPVLLVRLFLAAFLELAALEPRPGAFSVAVGADVEALRQGVDGLGAHAVESDGLLEDLVVELAAGVEDAHGLDHGIQGDSAAEVAHGHVVHADVDADLLAEAHGEFVDGVVHDLLQEDVDAVTGVVAVAQASDIHTRTKAYVLYAFEGADVVVCVVAVIWHSS